MLYNLRLTYASQMITNGVDIIYVSKQLRHDNPNITRERYTHFIEEDDEKRRKKIEEIGIKMVTLKKEPYKMPNIWGLADENTSIL